MKKRTVLFISVLLTLFVSGCKYDFIMPEPEAPSGNPAGVPVSFSTQIAPIFSTGTKCTACHLTGGQAPDLTAANAFARIVPGLINSASPESSLIYSFPLSTTSTHSWKKYTAGEAALILTWIKEGAKNN